MSKVKKGVKKFNQKKAKGAAQFKRSRPQHKRHGHKHANGVAAAGKHGSSAAAAGGQELQQQQPTAAAAGKRVEDMELDEFLDGGFEAAAAAAGGSSGSEGSEGEEHSSDLASGGEDDSAADLDDVISEGDDVMAPGSDEEGNSSEDAAAAADDDGDEGSEGEGVPEGGEAAAVAADNKRLRGAVSRHKQQLEDLKHKDPEFYEYLQSADAELLGFGEDDEEEGDEDSEDEEEDSEEEEQQQQQQQQRATGKDKQKPSAKAAAADSDDEEAAEGDEEQQQQQAGKGVVQVTSVLVERWSKAALDNASLGAMMQLVKAYRAACHYGDSEQEMSSSLSITSGAVFNKVLLFMLKEADGIFRRMLGLSADNTTAAAAAAAGAAAGGSSGGSSGKASVLLAEQVTKAPRWRKVEPLVKSYLGNSVHLLSSMTQPAMTAFTLRRLRASAAFLGPFSHLSKKLMRLGLKLYGSEEPGPRLQALLLLRQMALVLPPPTCQAVLRGAYRSYVSTAKFVSPASLPTLNFMAAGFVELSSLDPAVTYQVGFVAVRELAVLLRNALAAKTQDAHKEVYCWQTLMCLELWVKVLAAAAPQGALQPLVYPVTQLLLGAARLVPTPRYFPIRLRLVRALNRLAQATGVYIPVSPLLLEMLSWSELRKTPTGTAAAPDLLMLLRLSKTQLKTSATQEEVVAQVLELLTEHLAQWSTSISFPELSHLPCVALRAFAKGCAVERFRRQARSLVEALERNSTHVGNARDAVAFAPQDLAAAAAFLSSDKERAQAPLSQYARQLLQKAAARLALRSSGTQEMQLKAGSSSGKKRGRQQQEEEEDSSDDEQQQQQEADSGSEEEDLAQQLADGDADMVDSEEEEQFGADAKRLMRQREKKLKRSTAAAAAAAAAAGGSSDEDADAAADEVADYQLSDDDEDEGAAGGDESSEGLDDSSDDEEGGGSGSKRPKPKQKHGSRQQQRQQKGGKRSSPHGGVKKHKGDDSRHGGSKKQQHKGHKGHGKARH